MSLDASLSAELYRLRRTRAARWALLLPAAAGLLRILVLGSGDEVSGFGPLADGLRAGGAVLSLTLLLLGALLLVRDRERGALGVWFLARSRERVVLGKVLALLALGLLSLAVLVLSCGAAAAGRFSLGPVVEEGFEMASAAELWGDVGRAVLASLPALVAAAAFGLFVSSCTSSGGAAVAGTLVPFILFHLLRGLFADPARYVFASYVPFLGEEAPLARLTDVARAYSDAAWEPGELTTGAWVTSLQAIAMLLLAMWTTRRRSV